MRLIVAVTLVLSLILAPLAAEAQPPKVARLGFLVTGSLESPEVRVRRDAFRTGLRELGYVEGQNIVIEYRGADGKIERLLGLATELTRLKVDLIIAVATPAARAAQQATIAIPIVATAMGDPVQDGLVASLARPGGNVTGTTFLGPELVPKRLELLKHTLPRVSRVAGLWHPGAFSERTMRDMLTETEAAAGTLGVQLQTRGSAGSRRVRSRILDDDQRARRGPPRVSEHDALRLRGSASSTLPLSIGCPRCSTLGSSLTTGVS